jgi:hypothetical protein
MALFLKDCVKDIFDWLRQPHCYQTALRLPPNNSAAKPHK